jgi:signal transduction histidine kinase
VAVVALLVTLLALLAALQYRWTGEVERAEEERARSALLRAAWSVSGELDGELGHLYGRFVPRSADLATELPVRLAAWRATALEPRLLREVLVARRNGDDWKLERWDETGGSAPFAWPAELAPLRERLMELGREPRPWARRSPETGGLVPALISPLSPGGERFAGPGALLGRDPDLAGPRPAEASGLLLLWLDTRVLVSNLLPELIGRHFGDGVDYRIEVRGIRGERLYARGPLLGRAQPDAVAPLFVLHGPPRFGERPPFALGPGGPPGPARSPAGERFRRPPQRRGSPLPGSGEAETQWQLRITHPAGSLSAAVARSRLRNLGISLAVLALLGVSVLLVLLNSRRAEALARRQIELVAGVSHELLTPVAAVRSAGENLAAGVVTEPEAVRRYGDLLVRESLRLGSLVEQVLSWAGLQTRGLPAAREAVEVRGLLESVAEAAAPAAEAAGVRIEVHAPEDVPAILGDRAALERALRNLVENSLKYGAEGGWIGLGAEAILLRRGMRGRSAGVALRVEDRGHGVDPADLPHLFEPFYRGRNGSASGAAGPVPGSGLGLALVQQIAREHGGWARVETAPRQGLRFILELPGAER